MDTPNNNELLKYVGKFEKKEGLAARESFIEGIWIIVDVFDESVMNSTTYEEFRTLFIANLTKATFGMAVQDEDATSDFVVAISLMVCEFVERSSVFDIHAAYKEDVVSGIRKLVSIFEECYTYTNSCEEFRTLFTASLTDAVMCSIPDEGLESISGIVEFDPAIFALTVSELVYDFVQDGKLYDI